MEAMNLFKHFNGGFDFFYWDILKSSIPYEKIDAYKIKFKVEIPKNSEKTFEFIFTEK